MASAGTYRIERRELAEQRAAVVRATLSVPEIGSFMNRAIGAVARAIAAQGVAPAGPPFARYHRGDRDVFEVEAGFPTSDGVTPTDEVAASTLPGGPVATVTYVGPYDQMQGAYQALAEWITARGGAPAGDPWEVYLSDPSEEPDPQKWRTEIVMPLRS